VAAIRPRYLVLTGQKHGSSPVADLLRQGGEVKIVTSIDDAIAALRADHFAGVFSDSEDFLPLERALVSQQANLILSTIGEGVCIVDGEGRCSWMNRKMQDWPDAVHQKIRGTCREAFEVFRKQVSPPSPNASNNFTRSKRYALNVEDMQFLEMIVSPVISPGGQVVQVVAVVWDATSTRRLQQKIDAIDKAGRELVRLEADAIGKMNVAERLKLLEDKIISFTKELMHFDHFAIRLLDRRQNKLEVVISQGLPQEALNIELFAEQEGNGISGYVAATGRSYICADVHRDSRYVRGLDHARSSLTVPLRLHDKVIGVFNIESRQPAAFTEDDRQFAEIFGRYVAVALNILDLMVVERMGTAHKIADNVCAELAGPLNDISLDVQSILDEFVGQDDLRKRLQQVMSNVEFIRSSLRQTAEGPNTVLGAKDMQAEHDPALAGARMLVVDDEPNIRATIGDILRKYHVEVTIAQSGADAIARIEAQEFDLVLSDIKMPDKTGYDVFAAARKKSGTLPVILMTGFGYDPSHSIVRASQEGLQAVLFKPFKVDQLLAELRKALASRVSQPK
jgi:CheY-like chemotaxis protein